MDGILLPNQGVPNDIRREVFAGIHWYSRYPRYLRVLLGLPGILGIYGMFGIYWYLLVF